MGWRKRSQSKSSNSVGQGLRKAKAYAVSLRMRLTCLVLLAVVPAFALMYTNFQERRHQTTHIQADALQMTRLATANQARLIDSTRQLLVVLAQLPQMRPTNAAACSAFLANLRQEYPVYVNLGAVTSQGDLFCSAVPLKAPLNLVNDSWVRDAVKERDFWAGDYQIGRIAGKPAIFFSYPVLDEGKVKAVVFAALDLTSFSQRANVAQLPPGSTFAVIDSKGIILARYPNPETWVGQAAPETPLVKTMLRQKRAGTVEAAGVDGVARLYAIAPLEGACRDKGDRVCNIYVSVGIPKTVAFAAADRQLHRNLAGMGLVAVLAIAATWVGSDVFILRRVKALLKPMQRLSEGDLSVRTGVNHGFGVSQLAGAFDTMAASLERSEGDRKQSLEALRESETRYRLVAKASNDAIWDWDLLTNRVEWNESIEKLFGYSATEVGFDANWWCENIHPEDRERVVSGIHAAIDSGRQIWSDEYRYRRADNSYALVIDRGLVAYDDRGNPVRIIGSMTDISESLRHATLRKQAETLIAGQKQVLEMIATGAALVDVLDVLVRFIEKQSGESFCAILLVDEKENKLRHGAAPSLPESYNQAIDGIAIGAEFGCCSKAAFFGKPVIVSDIDSDRLWADFGDLTLSHKLRSCWSTPIFSSNGKVLGIFVMYHPEARQPNQDELHLTTIATQIAGIALERQQAEEALQHSEEQLRLIADALPVLIAYINSDQCYHFNNRAYEQWFGKSQAEVTGQHIRKVLGESAYQAIQQYVEAALSGQEVTYESAVPYEYGGTRWVNATYLPHFGEHGEVKGFIALVSNITERKAAEEALRQSEERYRSLARATSQMVWTCNAQGEVVTNQPDWRVYTGQSEAEILGWRWLDAIHPDDRDRIAQQWSDAIQSKNVYDTEFRLRRADSIYRYFNVRGVPVLSKDGDVREWIGTCTDITEKVQAEEAIRQLNGQLEQRVIKRTAQLEAANQELEAFCYSISHDLRSPLRAINGFSRILLEEYREQLDPEAQRYQQLVQNNAQQMGQLIDDLLAFSRLSRQPLRKQTVAIADLVRQVLRDLWHEQQNRQFEMIIGNLPTCEGDPALLKQVVVNLLTNALKFTRGREVAQIEIGWSHQSLTNDPELETDRSLTNVVYFVKDNGAGFDMRYAHKLFGVFQRLHRAEDYEGTGVGLAIVQRIIHRHGGRIWAESVVNQGTTFYFTLTGGNTHE
ncbi:PAS domain S-box protein [Coleofasciculus sp. H7-2]|uniref:PAS domain S-box protein n=1 Tax=Coleofasciculus sp. H7-2 TaxID=3351545 RepID=UPI0036726163